MVKGGDLARIEAKNTTREDETGALEFVDGTRRWARRKRRVWEVDFLREDRRGGFRCDMTVAVSRGVMCVVAGVCVGK